MTSAVDPIFVDTSILVYASWAAAPLHKQTRTVLESYRRTGAPLHISRQSIREWLATLNRPDTGLALDDLMAEVRTFDSHFIILDDTAMTTMRLFMLMPQANGMSVHDVHIVATMQTSGIRRLLTHHAAAFTPFQPVIDIISLV